MGKDAKDWDVASKALVKCILGCESSHYQVFVEHFENAQGELPATKVREHVRRMLDIGTAQPFSWAGWYIEFDLRPSPQGQPVEALGGGPGMVQWIDDVGPIRRAITKGKGGRYGKPDKPYAIAIQALSNIVYGGQHDTFARALFGDEVIVHQSDGSAIRVKPQWSVDDNDEAALHEGERGAGCGWKLASSPRCPVHQLLRESFQQAARPLANPLPRLSRYEVHDDRLVFVEGEEPRAVLGL